MKCKFCKSIIEDGSLYCRFCGGKQFKGENCSVSVPKPRLLADGTYSGQMMIDGHRVMVKGSSLAEYELKAKAMKTGKTNLENTKQKTSLHCLIDKYISENENVLSPSTIYGYKTIRNNRFQKYMFTPVNKIDWQKAINEEILLCSPKTLKNAWGLISAVYNSVNLEVPNINLPMIMPNELPWLKYEEIKKLLISVKGQRIEMPIILALHSLRLSELMPLTVDDIYDGFIHINKTSFHGKIKAETKTVSSCRNVPIIIPRLEELLPQLHGTLVVYNVNSLYKAIHTACINADVPEITLHGLRRSFASLGYQLGWSERTTMALGGWSDLNTVHKHYIKLDQEGILKDADRMKDYYQFTISTAESIDNTTL